MLLCIYPWKSSAANKKSVSYWTQVFHGYIFFGISVFYDIHSRKVNGCSNVCHNRQGMPTKFVPKNLILKKGDIICKVKEGTGAVN